jgi:dienelactone hydrolase
MLSSMTPAQINSLFILAQIPITAQNGVDTYKIIYETVDPFNAPINASGELAVPQNPSRSLPLVSYQHGTILVKTDVPSALSEEGLIAIAFASTGYVGTAPDYLGLGDSPGLHPYHHAKSEATAAIDLLRAARTFSASNAIALNGQLFLCGYSQGGHATMAVHKELEASYTNEFTVTASAPMAGAYDLSGTTADDFLSDRVKPNPYYLLYLLAAYQEIYHLADSLADLLAPPYDASLPPLLDGTHDGGEIDRAIGSDPTRIVRPDYLAAFKADPNHPLRAALRENDLYAWTPRAPVRMCHCRGDQDVLYANSEVAYHSFLERGASQVELIDPNPAANHGGCVQPSMLGTKAWFDSLRK